LSELGLNYLNANKCRGQIREKMCDINKRIILIIKKCTVLTIDDCCILITYIFFLQWKANASTHAVTKHAHSSKNLFIFEKNVK